jgi:hypothetical protein
VQESPEPPLASPLIGTIAPRHVAARSAAEPVRQPPERVMSAPVGKDAPEPHAAPLATPSPDMRIERVAPSVVAEIAGQSPVDEDAPAPNVAPFAAQLPDIRIEPVLPSAPAESPCPSPDPLPATAPPASPAATTAPASYLPPLTPEPAAPTPTPAPAEPSPAGRAAPVAWPARQIAPFAVALALGPDASLNLTLEPVELGRVEIAIERNGMDATVSVHAERPETLALLQRDRVELERALANAGFGADGRGATLHFGNGGDNAERRGQRGHFTAPSRNNSESSAAPHETQRRGLLDLAV